MRDFISAIHEASSNIVSSLPVALFAPVETGLMRTARHKVVTRIAGLNQLKV